MSAPVRIGAVRYLNAKPLTHCLAAHLKRARIRLDLPSRLARDLARGRLDVALIPSIEYFRGADYRIVPGIGIASRGPVLSVKLFSRVPLGRIRRLALDEGSRTSATLARIILAREYGIRPAIESFPIAAGIAETTADAILLIGDRAMAQDEAGFESMLDLGEEWQRLTGLPFVYAMWVARPGIEPDELDVPLARARDEGLRRLEEIARHEAARLGFANELCLAYLRDAIHYDLGPRDLDGLRRYYTLACEQGLAPEGVSLVFADRTHCAESR